MTKLYPSRVALGEQSRTRLIESLNRILATTLDLRSQVKQAHWNIKGPQFFARHLLFDRPVAPLSDTADEVAERVSTLGGYAQGTTRLVAELSGLPEYDLKANDGQQHITALSDRFGLYAKMLREGIATAAECHDPATEDLLTEALRKTELDLWFLESHIRN